MVTISNLEIVYVYDTVSVLSSITNYTSNFNSTFCLALVTYTFREMMRNLFEKPSNSITSSSRLIEIVSLSHLLLYFLGSFAHSLFHPKSSVSHFYEVFSTCIHENVRIQTA